MALAIDTAGGAPVVTTAGGFGASGTSLNSNAISSVGTSGKLVVLATIGNINGTGMGTPSLSGGGLSWSKITEGDTGDQTHFTQVWTADYTSQLSAVVLTLTWTTGVASNWSASIVAYPMTGVGSVTAQTPLSVNGTPAVAAMAASASTSGSWTLATVMHESGNTGLTLNGSTQTEDVDFISGAGCGSGACRSTTTGSFNIGWTENIDWGSMAGVVIAPSSGTPFITVTDPVDLANVSLPYTFQGTTSPPGIDVSIKNAAGTTLGSTTSNGTTGAWSINVTTWG